ncbi:MAG TPA: hypothetical protein VFK33_03745 [Bacillales bacterium]|nr:hypothetical protein [Bacillales bacterium]
MKQRLLLSLLAIAALGYFALPRLPVHGDPADVLFSWVWIGFCVVAFGGNLAGLLYRPVNARKTQDRKKPKVSRVRPYKRGTGAQ